MSEVNRYGYYLFLGLGDFKRPAQLGQEWTSAWSRAEWLRRLDRLAALGANTIFLYLMGWYLPYASDQFRECVERSHPNVDRDFLQDVLDACGERGMEVVAVFSTTGHAHGYAASHPGRVIVDRKALPVTKSGILCHNREGGLDYPLGVIRECLGRYHGFAGAVLHPPEFGQPCFCAACRQKYMEEGGKDLGAAADEDAKAFFMRTNLAAQRRLLEPEIRARLPGAQLFTFTIPWVFKDHFEALAGDIDARTIIVDWDYKLTAESMAGVRERLQRYRRFGHRLWFMPTAGYAFSAKAAAEPQARAVLDQIRLVRQAGVRDIIYFVGPVWWPTLEMTSWHLHG